MILKIIDYIKAFYKQRYFYSKWFCYKYLPKELAKYTPIRFYRNSRAKILNGGQIILENFTPSTKIYVGNPTYDFEIGGEETVIVVNNGKLVIKGKQDIRRGTHIEVRGELVLGCDGVFGPRCNVRAHNRIILGDVFRVAHETQLFDSNFHFVEKVDEPGFYPCSKPIIIGNYCWIGNRSTISPGTVLPDYTTVTSNSVVNKDFSSLSACPTIGGVPAKFIREGWTRVWDTKREQVYHKQLFPWYGKNQR